MSKEFLSRITVPVVLGAMSMGGTDSGIVSAMVKEGGTGTISASGFPELTKEGYTFNAANVVGFRREIRKTRMLTDGIFGANVLFAVNKFIQIAEVAFQEEIDFLVCGAGYDSILAKLAKKYPNTRVIPMASSATMVNKILRTWKQYDILPGGICYEGPKAGGHLGFSEDGLENPFRQLEVMVPRIRNILNASEETKHIPLIAGGGIYTREDAMRVLSKEVGADLVQMATRFILTEECSFGKGFKDIHKEAAKRGTTTIDSPVGLLGRVVCNEFIKNIGKRERKEPYKCPDCLKVCKYRDQGETFCILNALMVARVGNKSQVEKYGLVFGGKNSGRSSEIVTVKQIMDEFRGLVPYSFLQSQ